MPATAQPATPVAKLAAQGNVGVSNFDSEFIIDTSTEPRATSRRAVGSRSESGHAHDVGRTDYDQQVHPAGNHCHWVDRPPA